MPTAPLASVSSIKPPSHYPSCLLTTHPAAIAQPERGSSHADQSRKERVPDLHRDIYRYSSPDVELDTLGHAPGTAENPLIPKRRRRTSPAELAILEIEFARNPLPSQGERSRIADRVGMTGRAAQVWFQNRRQKEKKDANTYHGGSDVGSSNGSAPDPDQDVSDLDAFTYSSSPAPAPSPPLTSGSTIPSHLRETSSTSTPANTAAIPPQPVGTFSFLSSSEELYAGTAGNKENDDARLPSFPAPSLIPNVDEPKPEIKAPEPTTNASEQAPPTFVHRLATTSIITAKKHVTKRPLGSHAPLARQTSLSHNFDFPPSPVKGSKEDVERPTLRRKSSTTSVASTGSGAGSGAGGKVGGLFSLTTNEDGRARVWVDALNNEWEADAKAEADDKQLDVNAMEVDPSKPSRTTALSNDQVWQHMASDPPSSFSPTSSPVPLTRKMMLALAAQDSRPTPPTRTTRPGTAFALSMSNLPSTARRPPLVRAHSLGGGNGSRAGGEETCAEMALGRKRARMGDDASSSGSSTSRKRSTASKGATRKRDSNGLTVSTTLASSSSSASEVGDSSIEMGELSFSSTSTAFSAEIGTPVLGKRTLVGRKSEMVVGSDEERECAELLLGLGGSFF